MSSIENTIVHPGKHIGGIRRLWIINRDDVDWIFFPNANGQITQNFDLVVGKAFKEIIAITNSVNYRQTEIYNAAGKAYRHELQLVLPYATYERLKELHQNNRARFVVLFEDGNGTRHLMGNKMLGCKMKYERQLSGPSSGKHEATITFEITNQRLLPEYTGPMAQVENAY